MGFSFGDVPQECSDFCFSQYDRFKIPFPIELLEVLTSGASAAFYYMDCVDPYAMLHGVSDVEMTDDWAMYAYEIVDGNRVFEADPTSLETYKLMPGQDEAMFNQILSYPGLDALPYMLGCNIRDVLSGEYGSDAAYSVSADCMALLKNMCLKPDGSVNREMVDAYFELSSWATTAWLIGPLGRSFRYGNHEVFSIAMDHGEAVLFDGAVLDPRYYRKLPRAPRSCLRCGLSSWCVEMVSSGSSARYLCEHCLSEGMPPSSIATCGSKRCLLATCPHHPYHHLGSAGIYQARTEHGQLSSAAKGETALRIKGGR